MASLYKRATPAQARMLRIVAGAVMNAAHAHPEVIIPESFARSVAKRAAGTLTAQWPEVLAANCTLSESGGRQITNDLARGADLLKPSAKGSADGSHRRSPLDPRAA